LPSVSIFTPTALMRGPLGLAGSTLLKSVKSSLEDGSRCIGASQDQRAALSAHASLIASRDWGLAHIGQLSAQAAIATGVPRESCLEYFAGLDYRLSYPHLAGLTEFFRRLVLAGRVPDGTLAFLPAA
jgi:hypothetical protein